MLYTFSQVDLNNAVTLMWKGMLGIFVVIALLTVVVMLLTRIKDKNN